MEQDPIDPMDDEQLPGNAGLELSEEEALALAATLMGQQEQQQQTERAERDSSLAALALTLKGKRKEAIDARRQSGIEEEWIEDEEAYQGIDDANRHEVAFGLRRRRAGLNNAYQFEDQRRPDDNRSTVFVNITRGYVDAAAARIGDMLLPVDDRPWSIEPTPIPTTSDDDAMGQVIAAGRQPTGEAVASARDEAERMRVAALDKAKRKAENAQRRIEDWHVQCSWHAEVRKVIDDAARLGTGILKGPFPVRRKALQWQRNDDGSNSLVMYESIDPASRRIDPWDFYPDPACGENIHNGSYTWERDRITSKKLTELKGLPGYFDDQIDLCLKEKPARHEVEHEKDTDADAEAAATQYEIWYFYGVLSREDVETLGDRQTIAALGDAGDDSPMQVPVIVTMVNDRMIRLALNPIDSGAFPYDVLPWQVRVGMWCGRGVARQIRTPQRMVNAGTRNMMDNARWSAKPILVMRKKGIDPANGQKWGSATMYFVTGGEGALAAARDFIAEVKIDSRQAELQNIINFALKMAEDVTGLPLLLQGQTGKAPDTVGGMTMLYNNANGVLRRIAKLFDDYLTEPHIGRYYHWLMAYSEDPNEQGDFQINARGSSALVERDLQNQAVAQMGAYVNDPEFRINKEKWFAEWSKSQRLDPKRFQYTEDEWKKRMAEMPPPPPPERVQVAQIQAENRKEVAALNVEARRTDIAADVQARIYLAELEYANANNMKLADVRAQMAAEVMKDRRERDLFVAQRALKERMGAGVDLPG